MTEAEFAEDVVMELKRCSLMTYVLTKKNYRKLKRYFLKKAKKHLDWDKWQRRNEFDRFCRAFNVKISNGTKPKER